MVPVAAMISPNAVDESLYVIISMAVSLPSGRRL